MKKLYSEQEVYRYKRNEYCYKRNKYLLRVLTSYNVQISLELEVYCYKRNSIYSGFCLLTTFKLVCNKKFIATNVL